MHAGRLDHRSLRVAFRCAGACVRCGLNGGAATESNELPHRGEFAIFGAQSLGFQSQQGGCARGKLTGGGGLEQVAKSTAGAWQDLIYRAFE